MICRLSKVLVALELCIYIYRGKCAGVCEHLRWFFKKTDNSYENVQVWRQASGEVDGLKLGYWANGQSQSATTEAH